MSKLKQFFILSGSLFLIPGLALATSLKSMSKDEVKQAFSDKTISTISAATLDGNVISDSFTGYFTKEGKITGKFANKPDNEPQDDTGAWDVKNDGMLCFRWDHWNQNKEECFAIFKLKNGLLVINHENGFESFILDKDISAGNKMANGTNGMSNSKSNGKSNGRYNGASNDMSNGTSKGMGTGRGGAK